MASGVQVNPQCLEVFQELKLKKTNKYIIFSLNKANTEIIVSESSKDTDYNDFLQHLPEAEPRWAIYDFEYDAEGGGKRNKLVFVSWSPDDAKIKQKMVYASSKDALRRSLVGAAFEIQATDYSEVAFETVLAKAKQSYH